MRIRSMDYLLLAPEGDEPTPGGGGAQPAASSAEEVQEDSDPVVDDFLKQETPPEPKPGEEPPAPAAKPGEQPPAPAAKPAEPKPGEAPATPAAEPKPPAAQPPAAPAAAPAPTPTPTPVPAAAPQPPAGQPPAPVPAAAPAPQPPATPEPPKGPTPEEQERVRTEQRAAYVKQLTEGYAIPKEQHEALLTSPETVLPALAAEVHTRAVEAAIAAVMANIEPLVHATLERRSAWKRSEEEFFGKWPKLNTPDARPVVERLMAAYVGTNRGATRDQIMNDVGLMAMTQLRIPLDIPGAPGAPAGAPPAVFMPPPPPAAPGGGSVVQPPKAPSAWDKVDQELFGE